MVVSPLRTVGQVGVVPEQVAEQLQVTLMLTQSHTGGESHDRPLTFLLFSADGLRMVSSGRLGLGLGDSQELKKDWMKGSRFCPLWTTDDIITHQTAAAT